MDIPSWAKPGVKVVCVDDVPKPSSIRRGSITKGCIYTIETTRLSGRNDVSICLVLKEAPNISCLNYGELGWDITRFRPLISKTQEQDVALFKSLLTDIREGADV